MKKLVEEVDTNYFTRSSYNVKKDDDGNTLCTKKDIHSSNIYISLKITLLYKQNTKTIFHT